MASTLKRLYQGGPVVIPAPTFGLTPLTTATTGGTLVAGTYGYRVTALVGGAETLPSAEVSIVVPGGTSTNTTSLSWTLIPGATGYKIYGRTVGGELLLATVGATVYFYTDTGAATPAGALPGTTTLAEVTATPGLYTPPAARTTLLKGITVSNPTAIPGQVFLSVVASGGTGGASSRVVGGVTVQPDQYGTPLNLSVFQVLAVGDFLTGYVTIPGMVMTLSGVELS